MHQTLAFIGGGNMARSLIGGLLARGMDAARIIVASPAGSRLTTLGREYAIRITSDNNEAVSGAQVVVLAVKPQQMRAAATGLARSLAPQTLIVSVAAGIEASVISGWCGGAAVVRCMPNRPALQGCGMTALYASANVKSDARQMAERILSAVGATLWIDDESQMDAVTAVSGTGPAYFFLLIEILEQAAVDLGLSRDISRKLAIETAYGSGRMARETLDPPATLRQQVASKGGTTEAALRRLEAGNIRGIFADAIAAAARRSAELGVEFGAGSSNT